MNSKNNITIAWGDEEQRVPPVWVDAPKGERDGNIGVKMYTKMHNAGFKIQSVNIVHPVLTTKKEKELLLLGIDEMKQYYLDQGHAEADWQQLVNQTQDIVNNEGQIAGFYGSFQAVGVKSSL